MVCVLKDGDSCRHHPLRPIPTHHISLILPTDGTHTDFLDICLLTPQHIPGSPSSKRENVNHLIPKHQCLWRHSHHDKAYKGEIASPDPVSKETSAQVKSFRPYRQWQQSKDPRQANKKKKEKKWGQTAPPCGSSTLTCYFGLEGWAVVEWGRGRERSLEQTTQDTYKHICVQMEGQIQLLTSLLTPNFAK